MIKIRQMTNDDMKMALSWAASEGWNPGKHDADAYSVADKNGCFILEKDKAPIGSITAVKYSDEFAFIGLFIVTQHFRKNGYGKMLWDYAIKYLENCKCIGLYAVPERISSYKLSGFDASFKNFRWSCIPKNLNNKENDFLINDTLLKSNDITNNPESYIDQMALYENSIFKVNRRSFLEKLIKLPGSHCILSLNNNSTLDIDGFVVIRPCVNNDYRIGPLYANNVEIAKKLIKESLIKVGNNNSVFMDCPEKNDFFKKIASIFGFEYVDKKDTVSMYKGEIPDILDDKIFAVASLELC